MNGIVHPCTHPEGRDPPANEDEMMVEVFRYTDNVLQMARPRKVLMIAVDGVAPRAKMNQQRSRRFRAAQDAKIEAETKEAAVAEAEARGEIIDEAIKGKRRWDSNVITPGTPFMSVLAKSIRYWTAYKLTNDPGWKDLKVIISDATVPGEGEHKIMEFIRSQRTDPTYNPNTSHCIYGLDADLIFLGLATHEPHFKILREDVFANGNKGSGGRTNFGLTAEDQKRKELEQSVQKKEAKPFIWLHIDILRQYLEVELFVPDLTFPFNFERAIDDWVFMCFFVGNDFLPHLPSLDVRDHGVDRLTRMWKGCLKQMKGYMTCDGNVDLSRVEVVLKRLGSDEDGIINQQKQRERNSQQRQKRLKTEREQQNGRFEQSSMAISAPAVPAVSRNKGERAPIQPLDNMPLYSPSGESVGTVHMSNSDIVKNRNNISMANMANKSAAEQLKAQLLSGNSTDTSTTDTPAETPKDFGIEAVHAGDEAKEDGSKKRKPETPVERDSDDENGDDPIQLGKPGYRERYYSVKFHVPMEEVDTIRREVVKKYIEGICWVLLYYYQGCASWNWYFPYHYAPFARDLRDIGDLDIKFDVGTPFRPYEQLMSVLPAASNHTLPHVFRSLMSEPDSDIIDFYPVDFPIDMNGKKMSWQGIALLPFIDEKRLLKAVQEKYPLLTADETFRNTNQKEYVMISKRNVMYENCISKLYESDANDKGFVFNGGEANGLSGTVFKDENYAPNAPFVCPIHSDQYQDIEKNGALLLRYDMPTSAVGKNKSMLCPGVKLIPLVLTPGEENIIRDPRPQKPNWNPKTPPSKAVSAERVEGHSGGYNYYVSSAQVQRGRYSNNDGYNSYGNGGYNNQYGQGSYRGGYNNGGYQGGYQGGQQGGYNNGGYNNGCYNNGGYNNGGYNNGGYNNGGYNNGGYQGGRQGSYNNGGYNGGGYNNNRNNNYGGNGGGNYNNNPRGNNYGGGNYSGRGNYHNNNNNSRGGYGGGYQGRGGYNGGSGGGNGGHYNNRY